jgi:hypothetical protein
LLCDRQPARQSRRPADGPKQRLQQKQSRNRIYNSLLMAITFAQSKMHPLRRYASMHVSILSSSAEPVSW